MKILMLINWKIEYCQEVPEDKQSSDYYIQGKPFWFYKYFENKPEVDVLDSSSFGWLERFERKKLHFYIVQALRAIPKLRKYDLVVSHGMPSAVIVALWRRLFKTKAKHIVFDIGCFNSASDSGVVFHLMRFVSKSLDRVIYHTSIQEEYYKKHFPWLDGKTSFLRFGADYSHINSIQLHERDDKNKYILCIDSGWRDRKTLINAYKEIDTDVSLRFVGNVLEEHKGINGIEQMGRVPFDELIEQIDNSLFCVLPLVWKNYSYGQMTLLDQMALGKCVLASRVPSLVDYATDHNDVLFYRSEDEEDCKRVLKEAIENVDLRTRIGKNAKITAEKINEKTMANGIESIFNQTLS